MPIFLKWIFLTRDGKERWKWTNNWSLCLLFGLVTRGIKKSVCGRECVHMCVHECVFEREREISEEQIILSISLSFSFTHSFFICHWFLCDFNSLIVFYYYFLMKQKLEHLPIIFNLYFCSWFHYKIDNQMKNVYNS